MMDIQREFENFEACMEGHETALHIFEAGAKAALEYARGQQEPVALARLVSEAQAIVESKSVWKKFIDGTPLQNDIAVWMADFAEGHTPTAQPVRHPDDVAVDKFAAAMKVKLAQARDKGRSGWEQMNPAELSAMLYEHVQKGDPRDVANFCVFLWNLGQPITPCKPVPPDDSRQAALIDLAYINGAKAGWNMCVTDDESQFQKLTEGVAECVNVLKNTRSQATTQPVQPAVAVNEQLLDAAKLAKNHIHSASLCSINSMSSRSEMLHLMEKAIGQLGAAIAAAEAAKGGV